MQQGIVIGNQNKREKFKQNCFNTSYLTDSYIGFTLKMESVYKNTFFGLQMMVKSGLEKNYFEIPPCGKIFITEFVILGTFMK